MREPFQGHLRIKHYCYRMAKTEHDCFREAADRIWDMAKEYKTKGLRDLEEELKELAAQLHRKSRDLKTII